MTHNRSIEETQLLDDEFYTEARAVQLQGTTRRAALAASVSTRTLESFLPSAVAVRSDTMPTSLGPLIVCPGTPLPSSSSPAANNSIAPQQPQQSHQLYLAVNGALGGFGNSATETPPDSVASAAHAIRSPAQLLGGLNASSFRDDGGSQLPRDDGGSWVSASDQCDDEPVIVLPPGGLGSVAADIVVPPTPELESLRHVEHAAAGAVLPLSSAPFVPSIPKNIFAGDTLVEQVDQQELQLEVGGVVPETPVREEQRNSVGGREPSCEKKISSPHKSSSQESTAPLSKETPRKQLVAAPVEAAVALKSVPPRPQTVGSAEKTPSAVVSVFAEGDTVEVRWCGAWHPATVFVPASKPGSRIVVKWSDGRPEFVSAKDVRLAGSTRGHTSGSGRVRGQQRSSANRFTVTATQLVDQMDREDEASVAGRSTRRLSGRSTGTKAAPPLCPKDPGELASIVPRNSNTSAAPTDALKALIDSDDDSDDDETDDSSEDENDSTVREILCEEKSPRHVKVHQGTGNHSSSGAVSTTAAMAAPVAPQASVGPSPSGPLIFRDWFLFVDDAVRAALSPQHVAALLQHAAPSALLDSMRDVVTCCNTIAASAGRRGADGRVPEATTTRRGVAVVAPTAPSSHHYTSRQPQQQELMHYACIACGAVVVTEEWLRASLLFQSAADPVLHLHPVYAREGLLASGRSSATTLEKSLCLDESFLSRLRPVPRGLRALGDKEVLFTGSHDDDVRLLLVAAGAVLSFSGGGGPARPPDFTYTTPGKHARVTDPALAEIPMIELPFLKSVIRKWFLLLGPMSLGAGPVSGPHNSAPPELTAALTTGVTAIAAATAASQPKMLTGPERQRSSVDRKRPRAEHVEEEKTAQAKHSSSKDEEDGQANDGAPQAPHNAMLVRPAARQRPPPLEPIRSQHTSCQVEEPLLSTVTVGEATVSLGQDYYVTIPSSNADGSNVVMLARVVRITPNPTLTFHVRPYEFVGMQLMHVSLDNGASRVRRGISVELGQREFAVPPAALDLTTALFVLDDEMAQHVYFLAPSTSSARGRTPPGSAAHSVLSGVHKDLALDDHQLQQHIAVELLTTPNSKFPDAGPPHLFLDELSLGAAPTLLDGGGGGGGGGVDPLSPRPAGEAVVAVVNTGGCPLHLKWGPRPILKGGDLFFTQALLALNGAPALEVGKPVMVRLKRSHTSDDLGGASSNLINISSSSCDVVMISGIVASLRRQSESRMVLELQRSTDAVQLLIETEMMLVEQGPPPMIEALSVVPAKVMPRLAL